MSTADHSDMTERLYVSHIFTVEVRLQKILKPKILPALKILNIQFLFPLTPVVLEKIFRRKETAKSNF